MSTILLVLAASSLFAGTTHNVTSKRTSEMALAKAPDEQGPRRTESYVEGLARRATQDNGIYDVRYSPFTVSWERSDRTITRSGEVKVDFLFEIPAGHYLYKDKIRVEILNGKGIDVHLAYPPFAIREDPFFGKKVGIFDKDTIVTATLAASEEAPLGGQDLLLKIRYQGCSPKLCFKEEVVKASLRVKVVRSDGAGYSRWRWIENRLQSALEGERWLAYLLVFLGGLLTAFTPCVLPLIPLVLTFIGIREKGLWRNISLTLVLALSMATTYALLGVVAVLAGWQLGFLFQNRFFIVLATVLFFLFALGMLGLYDFQVPLRMRNSIAGMKGRGYWGAVLSGMSLGFLAAPCVGPVIAALLVWVATTRDAVKGFGLLFAFGIGMGTIFIAMGIFGTLAQRLKGGLASVWMKRAIGVLLLLPATYYGHLAFTSFKSSTLKWSPGDVSWFSDYEDAHVHAREIARPILVDFYAEWCISCIEWDKKTFSDPKVQTLLRERFVPLKVDCTRSTDECEGSVERFDVIGWPTILVVDPAGKEIPGSRLVGEVYGPKSFLEYLTRYSL